MDSKHKRKAILLSVLLMLTVLGITAVANWKVLEKRFGFSAIPVMEQAKDKEKVRLKAEDASLENEKGTPSNAQAAGGSEDKALTYDISYVENGFAGADPAKQSGTNLRAFLQDSTFFDKELSSYEKKMLAQQDESLYLIITSVEKDLRIQVVDGQDRVVTGVPFTLQVGESGSYKDQDQDGIVYIGDLKAGDYQISLEPVSGFEVPYPTTVTVKEKVEYTAIPDISLLVKTEADIIAAQEDTGIRNALEDADDSEIKDVRELGESGQMGIDVSKYNGEINWDKVRASGIRFAIIRAGYRGSSTGALVEDPYFEQNMRGALQAGMKVGVYFFTQAVNEVEAVEEASMVLSLCKPYNVTYPIFIDTEGAGGNGRADGLDILTRTAVCNAFCKTVENAGFTSGVYGSRNWFYNKLLMEDMERYCIWLAEYKETPLYSGKYQFWQYTSSGSVDGIQGRVDLDISYLVY